MRMLFDGTRFEVVLRRNRGLNLWGVPRALKLGLLADSEGGEGERKIGNHPLLGLLKDSPHSSQLSSVKSCMTLGTQVGMGTL